MAKNILVTESLSDAMTKTGGMLIEKLDSENAEVKAAFWFYFSDDRIWKLIIASPLVDTGGPRKYYKKIIMANKKFLAGEEVISINDISVTNTNNNIVKLLQPLVGTDDSINSIRLSRNTVNGIFIEDVYIYRLNL